ncbi:RnfH family protein [Agaribacterium sp. ZY112]|uniref:RnfH family protein n=1 Tax=Agaribacterium sp. ZY112 TaxID=3233574 RepID=UPI003526357A
MNIVLVYAASQPFVLRRSFQQSPSVGQAIEESGLLTMFKELDLRAIKVGIFGRFVSLDHQLEDGDRIELYRKITRVIDDDDDDD